MAGDLYVWNEESFILEDLRRKFGIIERKLVETWSTRTNTTKVKGKPISRVKASKIEKKCDSYSIIRRWEPLFPPFGP